MLSREQDHLTPSTPTGQHHHVPTAPVENFYPFKFKWNTNPEVARILYAAPHHPEWFSHQVTELPTSGSQQIFSRFDGNWFKNDAFEWRKRREGKLIREDHMKLKVNKQEIIAANYAHSAIVPTFHRRIYWLTSNPDIVLVHYLNTSIENDIPNIVHKICTTVQTNNLTKLLSRSKLAEQLSKIYADVLQSQHIETICDSVFNNLLDRTPSVQPTTMNGFMLERRNSCSEAFRSGLSSMALRRQPSTFSDSVDANYVGVIMNNCDGPSPRDANDMYRCEMDNRSHSGETQRSSNQDEEMSSIHPQSTSARSGSITAPNTISRDFNINREIAAIAPNSCDIKGGCRVLLVGEWYMKGHEYAVLFGDKKVEAKLIRPGVLSLTAPQVPSAGMVSVRVMCNDTVISNPTNFEFEDSQKEGLFQALIDRLHLIVVAFGAADLVKFFSELSCTEESILRLIHSLESRELVHPLLLSTVSPLPTRTIIHLIAALDFPQVMQRLLSWRRTVPFNRELDPIARDSEGQTPLHVAARHGNIAVARVLVKCCPSVVDVLDDRGRTPCEMATNDALTSVISRQSNRDPVTCAAENDGSEQHVTSTALWVMTNGETVTDEHLLKERHMTEEESTSSLCSDMEGDQRMENEPGTSGTCYSSSLPPLHVEISMDTDVHVPDSPKMADLFQAVTSPGVLINDGTRQKMANLAKQIIDALPARIKNEACSLLEEDSLTGITVGNVFTFSDQLSHMIGSEMNDDLWPLAQHNNLPPAYGSLSNRPVDNGGSNTSDISFDANPFPGDNSVKSSHASTCEGSSFDFDKDLGEFFTINVDGEIDPIQQRLGDLKLSDGEQREVYEAAMVIQRAYREYRERNTTRRQADVERRAAVTIQCCYRRYKQFCYFKKLHSAAIVVQKHFRLKKVNQRECATLVENDVQEHPTLEGQILRIQVPQNSSSLLREHRAAATIQAAYRGHRKRQAAARKIQKFMKESRMKLRRMVEQNDDVSFAPMRGAQLQSDKTSRTSHGTFTPHPHPINPQMTLVADGS